MKLQENLEWPFVSQTVSCFRHGPHLPRAVLSRTYHLQKLWVEAISDVLGRPFHISKLPVSCEAQPTRA